MAETDYARLVREAEETAAFRQRRGVRPPGGVSRMPGRQEGATTAFLRSQEPTTPAEAAFGIALAPVTSMRLPLTIGGKAAAAGGAALASILFPDQAEGGPKAPKLFTPKGKPIEGSAYSARARQVLDDIAAGPKGAGPIDLSSAGEIPGVPQVPLERYNPRHGVSERLQRAIADPSVIRGIEESVERGRGLGADKWYHTEPVRRMFLDEFGPVEGPKRMATFMDMVAATSPRSDVPTNIRNASYYYQQALAGRQKPPSLYYPYGHVAQQTHGSNFEKLMVNRPMGLSAEAPAGLSLWDVLANPKPASFSANLQGNLFPGTMDTHAFRNIGMRTGDPDFLQTSFSNVFKPGKSPVEDSLIARFGEVKQNIDPKTGKVKHIATFRPQTLFKEGRLSMEEAQSLPTFWADKPNKNEYAAAEEMYRRIGQRQGLPTADTQAAAWAGGGELTGLGTSPTHTFPELLNERILFTARMRGQDPTQTLRDFVTGRVPLLAVPAVGAASELEVGDRY